MPVPTGAVAIFNATDDTFERLRVLLPEGSDRPLRAKVDQVNSGALDVRTRK